MVSCIDFDFVYDCIINDYSLFYDLSKCLIQSVVALNQVCNLKNSLFKPITDFLVKILMKIRKEDSDTAYLIMNEVLLLRILPEIPLVNFSISEFFRLCISCSGGLSPILF